MRGYWSTLQVVISAFGGSIGYFLGGLDGFIYALVTMVIVDYVTGVMVAILEKKLSSSIGFRGIFKKVMIFLLVGIGHLFDTHVIGDGSAIRTAVIFFYICNEGLSILENAKRIGLPIPDKLKDLLAQVRSKGDTKS